MANQRDFCLRLRSDIDIIKNGPDYKKDEAPASSFSIIRIPQMKTTSNFRMAFVSRSSIMLHVIYLIA